MSLLIAPGSLKSIAAVLLLGGAIPALAAGPERCAIRSGDALRISAASGSTELCRAGDLLVGHPAELRVMSAVCESSPVAGPILGEAGEAFEYQCRISKSTLPVVVDRKTVTWRQQGVPQRGDFLQSLLDAPPAPR